MLKDKMNKKITLVENRLKYILQSEELNVLFDAMGYSIFAGGKRLRPLLLLGACEAVGGKEEEALDFACAIEMIHTYSLIHDDLPAMDNDDFRRGKPTNHKVYGEAIAILAGDGLLNTAYATMIESCIHQFEYNRICAIQEIAAAAGTTGMIGGQVTDILSENEEIDVETLDFLQGSKTGNLISAAITAGAMLGGADKETVDRLREAGHKLGVAFQMKDDILDVTSTIEKLGKPIKSDEKNKKATYVSMFGMEYAMGAYLKTSHEAKVKFQDALGSYKTDGFLLELVNAIIDREY